MIIIATGDRFLADPTGPEVALNLLHIWARAADERLTVIHGDAPGFDRIVREWVEWSQRQGSDDIDQKPYPANWGRFGKPAGRYRNEQMWTENYHQVDLCLAFPGGGPGTAHCLELARGYGCPCWINPIGQPLTKPPLARLIPPGAAVAPTAPL